MTQDPFGIDMIYQTKKNGTTWFMDNANADKDERFYVGGNVNGIKSVGNGFWICNDNTQVRLNAQTPQTVNMTNAVGGCNLDFADAELKGNTGMSDAWTNIEMTALINASTFSPSAGKEFIMKGPTFHHHQDPCCSGHAYGVRFAWGNPMQFQFFKEIWHSHYASRPDNFITSKYASLLDGQNHILKFVVYTKTVNNIIGRQLEAYIDFDADGKDFVKLGEVIDLGGWNDSGGQCNGKDDQILTWGSGWCMFRWDTTTTDLKFKNWSAREIDVSATPENNPTDPTDSRTTETSLTIANALHFDVNALRQNPCAVGGGGGGGGSGSSAAFYKNDINTSNPKQLSDSSTWQNRKRVVVKVEGSLSDCYLEIPKTCKFALAKVLSPNTNNVNAKIWNSSGSVVYTSPTNIADSSLTTTLTMTQFDFSSNTHALAVGDYIGVEYLGTSSSNYVITCYVDDIGGNDTRMTQYEGTTWQTKNREMCCELYNT